MKLGSIAYYSISDNNSVKSRNNLKTATLLFATFILSFLPAYSFADLENAGFESGTLSPWETVPPADVATLVYEQEGPANFQTYADLGITVQPKTGHYMLRLGSPKQVSEKQNRGDNTVFQTFSSTKDKLVFAARLFSWEHRGDDMVRISLKDSNGLNIPGITVTGENGSPLALVLGPGKPASCTSLPCEFVMDTGKSGDFIDTGWVVFELTGLPTNGSNIKLEYTMVGGQNESHATWVYFDNVNTPPVARFTINRQDPLPLEGDGITLTDTSYDPDEPNDYIASRTWYVTDPSCNCEQSYEGTSLSVLFSDNGTYKVRLTVTDSYGASDTVSSGTLARDNTFVPTLAYINGAPLSKALNQEVIAGEQTQLLARFVDPGFEDTHNASWSVTGGGAVSNQQVQESNAPYISSGIATATYAAPASTTVPGVDDDFTGEVIISDNDGGSAISTFDVKVLDYQLGRHEPDNNSLATAPMLNSDWVYRSDLSTPGDIDIFEVRLPNGEPLPAGSELLVKLGNLNADLDLVVLRKIENFASTPALYGRTPALYGRTPALYGRTPALYGRTPALYGRTPALYGRTPALYGRTPALYGRTPWLRDPLAEGFNSPLLSFDQIPLSELAYTVPDGTSISETDLSVGELGLADIVEPGVAVAAYSTNRGLDPEEILIRSDFTDAHLYIAVVGNNGAFTTVPYSLQIETSRPMEVETIAGDSCTGSVLVSNDPSSAVTPTSTVNEIYSAGDNAIFVTQKERIKAMYGNAAWANLETKLTALAQQVNGTVISVPSTIYDNWDLNPCSIEAANDVTAAIHQEILSHKSSNTEYVTLVGNDNIVPFRRVPDATSISNERNYTMSSTLIPGTPLYASVFTGQNLTDDYYVDQAGNYEGGLIIPGIVISRLVENPSEISKTIDDFLNVNLGTLSLASAVVTGYDSFDDGATRTAASLSAAMLVDTLIDDVNSTSRWTAEDLRCEMFGAATGDPTCSTHDINNFNAHFTHFLAQSSDGFTGEYADILISSEVANAANGDGTLPLSGELSFNIGCHGGMSVPDNAVSYDDPTGTIDTSLDFAQAMARQGSVYIGNTGFGLAGLTSVMGNEELIAIFAEELLSSPTVGKALLNAKHRYLAGLSTVTEYEEKASIQTTLYGLPMYAINLPAQSSTTSSMLANTSTGINVGLTVNDSVIDSSGSKTTTPGTPVSYELDEVTTQFGNYYVISNNYQATPARSIQPKVVLPISGGEAAHGVLITGADYFDTSPYNPVIAQPTIEWDRDFNESQVCLNAFWPSEIASPRIAAQGEQQSVIVVPAQFRCTSNPGDEVSGIERIFSNLNMEVLRSTSTDFIQPTIKEVDIRVPGDGTAQLTVDTFDPNGSIREIVLLVMRNGTTTKIESGIVSGRGPYTLNIDNFTDSVNLLLQVVDEAGNIAIWVGKGVNVRGIEVNAADSILYSTLSETKFTSTIKDFSMLMEEADSMNYTWEFGDGIFKTGLLAVKDAGNNIILNPNQDTDLNISLDQSTGIATFTVPHQYTIAGNFTAEIKVTDSFGGVGNDIVQMQACSDTVDMSLPEDGDLIGCSVTNNGSNVTVQLQVEGDISNSFQYRLYFDLGGSGNDPTPDGKPDLTMKWDNGNVTNSGKLTSLAGTLVNSDTLEFSFDLKETKFKGNWFKWQAETQSGVPGAPSTGFVDQMPDGVMFNYSLQ